MRGRRRGRYLSSMKTTQQTHKPNRKLTLTKESLRRLGEADLSGVRGGMGNNTGDPTVLKTLSCQAITCLVCIP